MSAPYRKQTFLELDNIKISQCLINYAIQSSTQIKETIAIKFLLLLPVGDNLVKTYDEMDFKPLHPKQNGWFLNWRRFLEFGECNGG